VQAELENVAVNKSAVLADLHLERQQIFAFKRLLGLPSEDKDRKMLLSSLQRGKLEKGNG
jgi:hypothetical protein